jgi:hypothetical protein
MRVPHYVVFDPMGWLSDVVLRRFDLHGRAYVQVDELFLDSVELSEFPELVFRLAQQRHRQVSKLAAKADPWPGPRRRRMVAVGDGVRLMLS